MAAIAARYGARVKVAEVPPGPPVLQTLVAEVYGPERGRADRGSRKRCARSFSETPGVVDVDWYIEADQPKVRFVIDKEKAALARHQRRDDLADAAARGGRRVGRICCTSRARRRT